MAGRILNPKRAAKRFLRLTEKAEGRRPISYTELDASVRDVGDVGHLRAIVAAWTVMALDREAGLILHALFSSAAFDGSARKAALRWIAKDEKRRAAERITKAGK